MNEHNDVYERLTERARSDGAPLVGMVAYAFYKKAEVEYCIKKAKTGTPITQEALRQYSEGVTETGLELFSAHAKTTIVAYAETYLEQNRDRITQEGLVQKMEELQTTIEKSTGFRRGFWTGFWSSLAATVFIVVVTMVGAYNYSTYVQSFIKAITPAHNATP